MTKQEEFEAIKDLCGHYGMPLFLAEVDAIIELVKGSILSVPLDKDPEKAALTLYAERMKLDGAIAVRNALYTKVKAIKEKK